jgi:hypothetical protein
VYQYSSLDIARDDPEPVEGSRLAAGGWRLAAGDVDMTDSRFAIRAWIQGFKD